MQIHEIIKNGIQALSMKDYASAQKYFRSAIEMDRNNELAWLGMSKSTGDTKTILHCLNQVLRINPNNESARIRIQRLSEDRTHSTSAQSRTQTQTIANTPATPAAKPLVSTQNIDPSHVEILRSETNLNPPKKDSKKTLDLAPNQPQVNAQSPTPTSPIQQAEINTTIIRKNVCPVCQHDDNIRKLVSIVEEGTERTSGYQTTTSETSISGKQNHWGEDQYHFPKYLGSSKVSGSGTTVSTTNINITRKTDLASQLTTSEPPVEPKLKGTGCSTLFMVVAVPIIAFIIGINIRFEYNFFLIPVILLLGELLVYSCWKNPAGKSNEITYEKELTAYNTTLSKWQRKMSIWDRLYYCSRDHIVFDPVHNLTCVPSDLESLLETIWSMEEVLIFFRSGSQYYGFDFDVVDKISKMLGIKNISHAPDFMMGIATLNDKMLPVIDLQKRFGLPSEQQTSDTRILVVKVHGDKVGVVVSAVTDIATLDKKDIEPLSNVSSNISKFVTSFTRFDNRLVYLLDPKKIITSEDKANIITAIKNGL